jgi:hypothetical protein
LTLQKPKKKEPAQQLLKLRRAEYSKFDFKKANSMLIEFAAP